MDKDFELEASSIDDASEGSAPASPQKGLPIRPLLRTAQRKAPLIAGVAGVLTFAAWLASTSDLPSYQGSFRMLVEPVTSEARISEPTALSRTDGGVPNRDIFSLDYPTQLEILRSPRVLNSVYEEVQKKYPSFTYLQLVKGLILQRGGMTKADETKILEIYYREYDPELVQLVLDELAKKYLRYSLEDRKTRISEGVKFIEDQLPTLQRRVDELEGQLQTLQQDNSLIDPASEGEEVVGQLRQVEDQQLNTQQELQEQKTLYSNIINQLRLSPQEAIAASSISQDPRYQQLLASYNELESQIALESARFTEESPIIQRLRDRQNNIVTLLNAQAEKVLGYELSNNLRVLSYQDPLRLGLIKQMVDVANQIQVLQTRNQILARNRVAFEQEAQRYPSLTRRYNELYRQLGIATRTLDQLLSQRESLRVAVAQNQVPWELISDPELPLDEAGNPLADPVSSRKKLMMGIVGGLVLGYALALLLEMRQDTFYTQGDVEDLVPAPLLASIPTYRNGKPDQVLAIAPLQHSEQELEEDAFQFLDAFNGLYASLRFLESSPGAKVLVVCSAMPGDGKTTTALHLAQSSATTGQRVLLVDANFRSPQIHKSLNLQNEKGLSDLLSQDVYPEDAIQVLPQLKTLSVLTAGHISSGSTRLLASPYMKDLMSKFRAGYDLVIYDTPNLHNAVDANFLASEADGILMVVAVRQTSRSKASKAIKNLNKFHLPIIGAVANRVKGSATHDVQDDDYDLQDYVSYSYDEGDMDYPQQPVVNPTFAKDGAS